ncbi:helix-turn-helix domain-containing protein [Acuticoccus sediminis]|uniref:helix-turn-helix domain-containing protein n=1 Tax=Acuticoccus sediminis TaxID=2184697 RepID=UPI001CFE4F41
MADHWRGNAGSSSGRSRSSANIRKKALDRLAAGESCREIARDMGVSASTISRLQRPIGA